MRIISTKILALSEKLNLLKLVRVGGVRGTITLANLLVFAILGHLYGTDAIGEFASYLALVTLFGSFIAAGMPQMLMRRISLLRTDQYARMTRWRSAFWLGAILSSIATLPFSAALVWLLRTKANIDFPWLATLGPAIFSLTLMISEEMRARGKAEASLIATNFPTIISPILFLLISYLFNIESILSGLVFTHIFSGSIMTALFVGNYAKLDLSNNKNGLILLKLSPYDMASMALMRVFSGGASHVLVLLTAGLGSPTLAGFVAVASRLAGLAATFTGIVNASFARKIGGAQKAPDKLRHLFVVTSAISVAGVGALMLPIIVLPSQFLSIFAVPRDLLGATIGLQILAAARIVRSTSGISDLFNMVLSKAYLELIATAAGFITLLMAFYTLPTSPLNAALSLSASVLIHGAISAIGAWLSMPK
ncbi:lipopolysaccharide biosynthesis protein [Oceanicaulis sp. LC35]|uniref:lipopolysaccharide biosynthesis protein n=1 Tax=Oceanicaulis sp. LC35 TaxID=3349635 RepID=UPI003F84F8D9